MSKFTSNLAPLIEEMLSFREALGYVRITCEPHLLHFDRFCRINFPDETSLTKEMVLYQKYHDFEWGRPVHDAMSLS